MLAVGFQQERVLPLAQRRLDEHVAQFGLQRGVQMNLRLFNCDDSAVVRERMDQDW
jgi:hypothetical protein